MALVVKSLPAKCRRCKRHWFDPCIGKISWRRKWQPTPVFLPGKSCGQKSLAIYNPWGRKELDMTEHTHTHTCNLPPTVVDRDRRFCTSCVHFCFGTCTFYSGSFKLYSCSSPSNPHFFVGIFLFDPYCFWKPFHLFSGLEFQLSSSFAKSNFGVYISPFPYCFWMISIKRRQKCQFWKQDRSSLNLNTFLSFIFLLLSSLYIFLFF